MEGGHDHPVAGPQLRAFDLPSQDTQLMPQQEQLSLGII
jgi:hypothetical protein